MAARVTMVLSGAGGGVPRPLQGECDPVLSALRGRNGLLGSQGYSLCGYISFYPWQKVLHALSYLWPGSDEQPEEAEVRFSL